MQQSTNRFIRFLILIMFIVPVMGHAENVYIERPGKEFSSGRLPAQADTSGQRGNDRIRFESQDRRHSQSRFPDSNRYNSAKQHNPWGSGGAVYSNPQHTLRPWGEVPANAPSEQRQPGRTGAMAPRYQPYYYRYQPAPVAPHAMPGYGGYGNSWATPYGGGYAPGYGMGNNSFFPFGSFGGMPGSGYPGGLFW